MKKIWIKFIKEYTDGITGKLYKVDEIVEINETIGKSLIEHKFAEETTIEDSDIIDDVLKGISDNFSKAIETATTKAIETVNKSIEKNIPKVTVSGVDNVDEYGFKGSGHFFSDVVKFFGSQGNTVSEPMQKLFEKSGKVKGEPTGLGTADEFEGGILVPETISDRIFELTLTEGINNFYSQTDQRQTSGNNLKINGIRKDGFSEDQIAAGVQAYWGDEADQYTPSSIRFELIELDLKKLMVLVYATDEQMEDASVSTQGIIERQAATAINYKTNESLLIGSGAGKPLGFLNAPSLVVIEKESGQADNTILHRNLNKMFFRMPVNFRNGAIWIVSPEVEEILPFVTFNDQTGASQRPVYMPPGGLTSQPFGTLYGRPVIPSQFARTLGQLGDISFVNWSQYLTLNKTNNRIKSSSSLHVRFLYDEVAFKFSWRLGGMPAWPRAIQSRNDPTRLSSPFIALNFRTETSSSGL